MGTLKVSRKDLKRKLRESLAGQAHVYHFAEKDINSMSTATMMASGVVLEIVSLGGGRTVGPVLIRDGLSKETVEAIKSDLRRSYDLATLTERKSS